MATINLQMPEKVALEEKSYTDTFGRFSFQPLEKGYGVTLGNSLRRILLSSIPGCAINGIKIEGVMHEFTTMPGMVEDVAEFILNLKEVRIKPGEDGRKSTVVRLKGPGEFRAGNIQNGSSDFTIVNSEKHIATLNQSCDMDLELSIGTGIGYVPADEMDKKDFPEGMIRIDAMYSPVQNVRYLVEQTRVGRKTDYENLILEVETDGTSTPVDVLKIAARILRDHLNYFINFSLSDEEEGEPEVDMLDAEAMKLWKILSMNIDEVELSVRSHNCLKAAGIDTIGDLVRRTKQELLNYRNFGQKSLTELEELIKGYGLTFGMDVDRYLKSKNK